jgi:tetratricopeptide (TPR) repeat protein
MRLYPLSRPTAAGALVILCLLAGCRVPMDWFGRRPGAPTPTPTPTPSTWEKDTEAGAKALEEGHLEDAERRLELAREHASTGTGNDLELAASLSNLAVVRRRQNDLEGAIDLQQQALAIRERVTGPESAEVASTLNSLGGLYALRDDYSAAEPLLKRALEIREKVYGPDDRHTAESLNNLALLYAAAGRPSDAEPLYQRSIAVFEKLQRPVELATTLDNYAALLSEIDRAAEAEKLEQRAKELREKAPDAKAVEKNKEIQVPWSRHD